MLLSVRAGRCGKHEANCSLFYCSLDRNSTTRKQTCTLTLLPPVRTGQHESNRALFYSWILRSVRAGRCRKHEAICFLFYCSLDRNRTTRKQTCILTLLPPVRAGQHEGNRALFYSWILRSVGAGQHKGHLSPLLWLNASLVQSR